jgi:hypothetical protein
MTVMTNPELTPDLIRRVLSLSREAREDLAFGLLDSLEELPPGPTMETILRRSEAIASGEAVLLTREEAAAQVRERMKEYGVEL